ncbi:MAG: peptide-methionine (R)-S-oxide reductase [Nanoarchaeota archaeon]|nr:peptide-methionine (R)-S-oxide reductase [Nanoarchaeota archaeon]
MRAWFVLLVCLLLLLSACSSNQGMDFSKMNQSEKIAWFKGASLDEKRTELTPQQYYVLVDQQMEASIIGSINYKNKNGTYYTAICDYPVFSSQDQFDGHSGWLDFEDVNYSSVQFREHPRTGEIQVLSICGEYLGYVIDNDALDSNRQFVINSVALRFEKTT